MFIGQLSEQSGFSKDTIRYYEKIDLIPVEDRVRQANNYKIYSDRALRRLTLIRELKTAGITLVEIADMLDSSKHSERPCVDLPTRLAARVARLPSRASNGIAVQQPMHSRAAMQANRVEEADFTIHLVA